MNGGHVLLAVSAGLVLAAGSVAAALWPRIAGGPVTVAHPAHVVATAEGGRCVLGGIPHGGGGHGPVRLTTGATGATVIWLPGLNSPCRTATTHLDAAAAVRFVAAVDAARPFPSGPTSCASEDGSNALVYVSHAGTANVQLVIVHLSGCGGLTAPGRTDTDWKNGRFPLPLGNDPLAVRAH